MNFEAVATRSDNVQAPVPAARPKMAVRHLDFFYGKFQASEGHQSRYRRAPRDRVHRTVGLRQVDTAANAEPDVLALPRASGGRRNPVQRRQHSRSANRSEHAARRIGMVFQKPTPFPMSIYDNIAFGVRLYESLSTRQMDERVEWASEQGGDVAGSEGQAETERHGAIRRPAAAAVHRPRGRREARRVAARRADLGARPDLDGEDRGADQRAARRTTPSPSSPTTCNRRRACPISRHTCTWEN